MELLPQSEGWSAFQPFVLQISLLPSMLPEGQPCPVLAHFPERPFMNSGTSGRRLEGHECKVQIGMVEHWLKRRIQVSETLYHVLTSGRFCVLGQPLEAARACTETGKAQ